MPTDCPENGGKHFESLERRRLLSFTPFGGDVPVPGTENTVALDMAVAGNGSFVVAAVVGDAPDATAGDLIVARYGADGEQIGQTMTIADHVGALISVSADAVGNAVVAYGGTFFALISNRGEVSAPVLANQDGGSDVAVSMAANGNFFVAWTNYHYIDESNNETSAVVRAFDAEGHPRGNAFTIETVHESNVVYTSLFNLNVAAAPDGSHALVSMTITSVSEGDTSGMYWSVVDTTHPIGRDNTYGFTDSRDVIAQADGSYVIGYESYGGSSLDEYRPAWVYAQHVNAAGEKADNVIALGAELGSPPTANETRGVSLATMPDSGFAASFVQVGDGANTLYARRYDASDAADESGVIPLAGTSGQPVIGADANGTAVVARIDTAENRVKFMRLASDFAFIQDSALYVIGTEGDDSISLAIDESNYVVHRGTETRTFAAADVNVVVIDGQAGDDTISNETALKATLRGGDGNDTLFGGSADDRLDGGAGSDSLWGNDGHDRIAGDDGHDYLYGNGGNDKIYGGLQPDLIRGNAGHDKLYGNGGADRIYGGASGDSIYGQGGNDQLFGEGGNDRLYCDYASGNSTLHGGAGDDIFASQNSLTDQLFGDGGHDSGYADENDVLTSIEATAV